MTPKSLPKLCFHIVSDKDNEHSNEYYIHAENNITVFICEVLGDFTFYRLLYQRRVLYMIHLDLIR